jgi:hypothetical protein
MVKKSANSVSKTKPIDRGQVKHTAPSDVAASWVPIAELAPWAANPRKNDDNAVRVAQLIISFGFGSPVLARRDSRELIAGHTRLKACKLLPGLWTKAGPAERKAWSEDARRIVVHQDVPVRYMALAEARAHLFALADNRSTEFSPWDVPGLHALLAGYDLEDLSIAGWDQAALDKLAAEFLQMTGTPAADGAEWQGMPEFVQPGEASFRKLIVHFRCQEDVDTFAALMGQTIAEKATFIWFPKLEPLDMASQHYATDGEDDEAETGEADAP